MYSNRVLELLVTIVVVPVVLGGSATLLVRSRTRARAARALHLGEPESCLDSAAKADLRRMQVALQRSRREPIEQGELAVLNESGGGLSTTSDE